MDAERLSGSDLAFLGDAVYSLKVRRHCLEAGYTRTRDLQAHTVAYVCADGQKKALERLKTLNFLNAKELAIFKRGRNSIHQPPKKTAVSTYASASGLEAVVGYLYLNDPQRLEEMFTLIFKEQDNE